MKTSANIASAAVLGALLLAGGCSGQNNANQFGGTLPAPTAPHARAGAALTPSQIAGVKRNVREKSRLDPALAKGRLLYVADPFANKVLIYTYPQLSGAGYLSGFASVNGVCTDRQGYVWILDTSDVLAWEFPHGGTEAINALQPGDASGNPGVGSGCSVDPKGGDLAVAGAGPGITVFRNGQETHGTYWDFNFNLMSYIGYDGSGDVYVDGATFSGATFLFAELSKGSSSLTDVTLSGGTIPHPGGIQWDGKNLDVGDSASGNIYQTNGSAILGTISTAAGCQGQFYILANYKRVIVPDPCNAQTGIYHYPAGGGAIKVASGGQEEPLGAAISVATR